MPTADDAADALYGAPLAEFIAERKRLGLAKAKKPALSAWVVNQLHRRAPEEMADLFAAGEQLRGGDFSASALQRAALHALRNLAAEILKEDGHSANEGTLLRVQKTLQALSALGTWEPDRPGQLVADRDPPGFDALAGLTPADIKPVLSRVEGPAPPRGPAPPTPDDERRNAEIERLEAAAAAARADVEARAADVAQLRDALEQAETALSEARRDATDAETAVERARRRA
jgi:hypothetical protein